MRADLRRARVTAKGLVCPLHRWHFNHLGSCDHVPGGAPEELTSAHCLKVFPVSERHGRAFLFAGAGAATLPFFEGENPDEFISARAWGLRGNNHWSVASANGFDLAHFEYVHQRKPLQIHSADFSQPDRCRLTLSYRIKPSTYADRWLVKRFGDAATLDYQVYHGNLVVARTRIGAFENRLMSFVRPEGDERFSAALFVFTPRSGSLWDLPKNLLAGFGTFRFFTHECEELRGVTIDPQRLGAHEGLLKDYFQWLEAHRSQRNPSSAGIGESQRWQTKASSTPVMTSHT